MDSIRREAFLEHLQEVAFSEEQMRDDSLGEYPPEKFHRVIAFSDIHGDLELLVNLLENTSRVIAIDKNGKVTWIGGERVAIVVVGDIVDRHRQGALADTGEILHEEKYMLVLLRYVDVLAQQHNGKVFKLLGNHEISNSLGQFANVSKLGFCSFDKSCESQGRLKAFQKGGVMYQYLADSLAILKIGNLIFVHGGIAPEVVQQVMKTVNDGDQKEGKQINFIPFVNLLVAKMFATSPSRWKTQFDPWFTTLFLDEKGILWNREFSNDNTVPSCERIQQAFQLMGYAEEKNLMFLLGHTGQSYRCYAEIKSGSSCHHAGYTLQDVVFENKRMRVLGGNFKRQKGIHGITFFCMQDTSSNSNPSLCLLDTSQSRAFKMKKSEREVEEARKPSLLDVRFRLHNKKFMTPFYYIVKSRHSLTS